MNTSYGSRGGSRISNLDELCPEFSFSSGRNSNWSAGKPTMGSSYLSRPRFAKVRRPTNFENFRHIPARINAPVASGFNPFLQISATPDTLSGYQNAADAFVFKASTDHTSIHTDANTTKDLIDEIRKLRINGIESGNTKHGGTSQFEAGVSVELNSNGKLKKNRFLRKNLFKNAAVPGSRIMGLEREMRNLNIDSNSWSEEGSMKSDPGSHFNKPNTVRFSGGEDNNFQHPNAKSVPGGVNVTSSATESSSSELPFKFKMMSIKCKDYEGDKNNVYTYPKNVFVFGSGVKPSGFSTATIPTVLPEVHDKLNSEEKPETFCHDTSTDCLFNSADAALSDEMSKLKIKSGGVGAGACPQVVEEVAECFNLSNDNLTKSDKTMPTDTEVCDNKVTGLFEAASSTCLHSQGASFLFQLNSPSSNFEFRSRSDESNKHVEFSAKKDAANRYIPKKRRERLKQFDFIQKKEDHFTFKGSCLQSNLECSESYSPMDVSPCPGPSSKGEPSLTSGTFFHFRSGQEATDPYVTASKAFVDEDFIQRTKNLSIDPGESACREEGTKHSKGDVGNGSCVEAPFEESHSEAESESFMTASEQVDSISDNTTFATAESDISVNSRLERQENDNGVNSPFSFEGISSSSFTFSTPSSPQVRFSATARRCRKNKMNLAHASDNYTGNSKEVQESSSLFQTSSGMFSSVNQREDNSPLTGRSGNSYHVNKQQGVEKIPVSNNVAVPLGDKWRTRGNQSYENGDFLKAEDCYTKGIKCIPHDETSRSILRALMLCYSNRAAARMALGRMRDALEDCTKAASIDPNFMRVQLRTANCYLALGEVEPALQYFQKCLNVNCVDRKIALEASEGFKRAQNVSECMTRCEEFLHHGTAGTAENALNAIGDALSISSFSDRLLEMKAKALFMMRKFDEVIHLCNQTLSSARKNSSELRKESDFWVWCHRLSFESYFHIGKLEQALQFIEKQEDCGKDGTSLEASIPLVATVRELLRHKASGNEAFQSGRYAEAVRHYTAAVSCNIESRPFAAICLCNRAAAYKALGHVVDAIADCSIAIALDENYLKAVLRRASLFEMIRKYGQAALDLKRYVSLSEKQAMDQENDLRHAKQRLRTMEEEARKEIPLDIHLILGVEPSANDKEVRKAYRKAALRHHPDKAGQSLGKGEGGDNEIAEAFHKDADELFKMIAEAYAILSDPSKRAQHLMDEEARKTRNEADAYDSSSMYSECPKYSNVNRRWTGVWKSYGGYQNRHSESFRPTRNY